MSKTTFLGYVPSLKEKHEAKIVGHKAIQSKGGSIRYTLQGLYDGRKTLPKTVSKADFEGIYGFDAKEAEAVYIKGKNSKEPSQEAMFYEVGREDLDGFIPEKIVPIRTMNDYGKKKISTEMDSMQADTVGSPSPANINQPAPSETPFPQEPSNENFSAECEECGVGIENGKQVSGHYGENFCPPCSRAIAEANPQEPSNENFSAEDPEFYQIEIKYNMEDGWEMLRVWKDEEEAIGAYYDIRYEHPEVRLLEVDSEGDKDVIYIQRNYDLDVKEAFGFGKKEEEKEEPKEQEFTVVLQEGDKLELTDIEDGIPADDEPKEEDNDSNEENEEKDAESNVRVFVVSSVDYDIDGREQQALELEDDGWLPQDFTFALDIDDVGDTRDMQEIADLIVDDISDETGFLVNGFYFQEKMPDGTLVDLNAENYEAVSAKVTRPVKEEEEEEEEEEESEGLSTLAKVGLGVGALAAGVALFGAEDEGESDYWSSENAEWRAEYVSGGKSTFEAGLKNQKVLCKEHGFWYKLNHQRGFNQLTRGTGCMGCIKAQKGAETFEASKHHGKSKKQRGKAVIHSRSQTNRNTHTDGEWRGVNDRNKKNLQGQTDMDNVNRAETFEARTTRKSFHNPITDESHDETASAKMIATPDGLHNTRRYERDSRNKKGHKRLSNPKKMDWDNADLSQDFTKTKQREKEDLRNIKDNKMAEAECGDGGQNPCKDCGGHPCPRCNAPHPSEFDSIETKDGDVCLPCATDAEVSEYYFWNDLLSGMATREEMLEQYPERKEEIDNSRNPEMRNPSLRYDNPYENKEIDIEEIERSGMAKEEKEIKKLMDEKGLTYEEARQMKMDKAIDQIPHWDADTQEDMKTCGNCGGESDADNFNECVYCSKQMCDQCGDYNGDCTKCGVAYCYDDSGCGDCGEVCKDCECDCNSMEAESKNIKMALGITAIGIGLAAVLGKDKLTKLFDRFGL